MKIAQLSPLWESVPPQLYGGTERIVSYVTEELVRQGHVVTLFASGDSKTPADLKAACPRALRLHESGLINRDAPLVLMQEAALGASSCEYDVILTDIRMPDLDGMALFQEVKRIWPERAGRVVFVTGDTLSAQLRDFADAGHCLVIEKPFAPSDVRRIIDMVVADGARGARA